MFDVGDEDSDSSSDECYLKEASRSRKRRNTGPKKPKSETLTWAEAAEIVLSNYDHPLPHKEILQLIEDANLKSMGRGNSAPLAVLNSMLNSHSRGPGATFYRAASGSACFGLNRTRIRGVNSIKPNQINPNNSVKKDPIKTHSSPPLKMDATKSKTYAEYKRETRPKQKLTPPTKYSQSAHQLKPPGQLPKYSSSQKQQLIPPGSSHSDSVNRSSGSLATISKATYDRLKQQPLHRRMGPTTSALVRPSPPFSRPPPGAALRVMPPKKRVKLDEDDDTDSEKNASKKENTKEAKLSNRLKGEGTSRRESQRNIVRLHSPSILPPMTKQQQQQRQQRQQQQRVAIDRNKQKIKQTQSSPRPNIHRSATRAVLQVKPRPNMTFKKSSSLPNIASVNQDQDNLKQSFLGVKFKRLKKANLADQIKRSKEGKLDLMSPDSILTSVHVKDLLNQATFKSLPHAYQYQLLMLLPECDRKVGDDGALRLSSHALNNAFFNRSCQEFKDKLMDGEFNSDIIQRAKNEVNLHARLDPWKAKFFEPAYGKSSVDNDDDDDDKPHPKLQPVESSWSAFLKFAENSTNDFEEALAKIQADVQKQADKEAREKAEGENRRTETLSARLSINSKKNTSGSLNMKVSVRSPITLKSKGARAELANKEKSKRALKKAQQLQRKKALDKQLKDAKAKIVQDARSSARKEDENSSHSTSEMQENIVNTKELVVIEPLPQTSIALLNKSAISTVSNSTTNNMPAITTETTPKNEDDKREDKVLNLSDSSTLKKLIETSETLKRTKKLTPKRKVNANKTLASRIVYGPSSFNTSVEGVCPCNLKAMVMCKQCGSFWHGDCVNGDKMCLLCTS